MRWPRFRWLALLLAVLSLQEDWAAADQNPNSEDVMRELFKIHQLFSSIARPSLRSDSGQIDDNPRVIQRAVVKLQELDRLYVDRARSRFGKRTSQSKDRYVPADYESQYQSEHDVEDWLADRR